MQDTRTDPAIRTIRRTRPHQASPQATPAPVCPGCGGGFHQGGRKQCPAYNLTCHTCKRVGHLAKVCRGQKQPPPAQSHPSTMAVQTTLHQDPQINASQADNGNNIEPAPTINVHISSLNGDAEIPALPDSGADISVAGEVALSCLGEHEDNLLPSQIIPRAVQIMQEFPTVFNGHIKTMEGEKFHIALTDNTKPFCIKAPRVIPFTYRDKLKAELELLQQQGIIAPVTEPTEWCAPIVITPKKDTDDIRMCVDLSRLNKYVKRERYQSLTPSQAVADIHANNAKIFTKLDAMKGYHYMKIASSSPPLLHHLGDSSISGPHTAYHPYQSTTIAGWMRPSPALPVTAASSTTSLYTIVILLSTQTTLGNSCKDAQKSTSH